MKTSLVVSISINVILAFILLKPVPKVSSMENYLLKRIAFDHKVKKERILKDSLRFENEIKIRDKKINKLHKIRVNEYNKFQSEITKVNNIVDSSDFHHYNDSIERCCTMRHVQYLY